MDKIKLLSDLYTSRIGNSHKTNWLSDLGEHELNGGDIYVVSYKSLGNLGLLGFLQYIKKREIEFFSDKCDCIFVESKCPLKLIMTTNN